jgi:hypothetical protein
MMSLTAAKSALITRNSSRAIRVFSASSEKVWKVYLSGESFAQGSAILLPLYNTL